MAITPAVPDEEAAITPEKAALGSFRTLWRRLLGKSWRPIRVTNAVLLVCSIGFIIPLFLPYYSQWERSSAFVDHQRTGQTFGFQEIGAWVSVLFGVFVVFGLFLGSSPNRNVRILGKIWVLVLLVFGFALAIHYFFDLGNTGAGAGTENRAAVGFALGALLFAILILDYLVSLPLKLLGRTRIGQ